MIKQAERIESSSVIQEFDKGTISVIWDCIDKYKNKHSISVIDEIIQLKVYNTSRLIIIDMGNNYRYSFNSVRKHNIELAVSNIDGIEYMCCKNEI